MFFLFLLIGQSKIKKYNLQDRRYLFEKSKNKNKKNHKVVVEKQNHKNSGKTGPDRRTVETQSHTEEQWKHGAIQRNSGNTEPCRRIVEKQDNKNSRTQDQTEEQWQHRTRGRAGF